MSDLQTIGWDNTEIYRDFNDPQLSKDLELLKERTASLESRCAKFSGDVELNDISLLEQLAQCLLEQENASIKMRTISVYTLTALSVDAQNDQAKQVEERIQSLMFRLSCATKPLDNYLMRVSDEYLEKLLNHSKELESFSFSLKHARKRAPFLLGASEEAIVTTLSQDGLHSWGKLYNEISSNIQIEFDGKKMGLAQANGLLSGPDRKVRENIYRLCNRGWAENEISVGFILNSINGWRHRENQLRSTQKELHYLDVSCHTSRIERETLDTLMETTYKNREVGHRALNLMATQMGVERLGPWDLQAPYPASEKGAEVSFPVAMEMVIEAFRTESEPMAEFAKMMYDKRWIDSNSGPRRRPGAYCTGFASNRTPRVFLTYGGSMRHIITLAHEIGHAYHNWVLREVPWKESSYPMTLAETASVFAETVVKKSLLANAPNPEEVKKILWQEACSASAFLVNIPARFEFEKKLVEARKESFVSPGELKQMMKESWAKWYGDSLSEYDEMFWANKLHFSISGLGFYNYPYLFGYLFSLGIYQQKTQQGEAFMQLYHDILRDTGRMSAEDVITKHLQLDIRRPDFWQNSINAVDEMMSQFSDVVSS